MNLDFRQFSELVRLLWPSFGNMWRIDLRERSEKETIQDSLSFLVFIVIRQSSVASRILAQNGKKWKASD